MEAERRSKGWSRAKKLALIRNDWATITTLATSKNGPSTSSGRTVKSEASSSESVDVETLVSSLARKSDVKGKSVYVRVDIGGRRIIKKNNIRSTNNPSH